MSTLENIISANSAMQCNSEACVLGSKSRANLAHAIVANVCVCVLVCVTTVDINIAIARRMTERFEIRLSKLARFWVERIQNQHRTKTNAKTGTASFYWHSVFI